MLRKYYTLSLQRNYYTSMTMEEKQYIYKYPHPAVTTDCVIFGFDGNDIQVLLIERGIEPYKGKWALPGGFVKMDESAEEGARRELLEETGVSDAYIEQFHTFSAPNRDPRERVITIAYYAVVKKQDVKGGDDAANAKWFSIEKIPQLAFDHDMILRVAMNHLRESLHFKPIGFELLPDVFTLRELQTLYEAILQVHFDRRNFAKKMLHYGLIEKVEEEPRQKPFHFRFNEKNYMAMKQSGFRIEF